MAVILSPTINSKPFLIKFWFKNVFFYKLFMLELKDFNTILKPYGDI